MTTIWQDLSPSGMCAANEANLAALIHLFGNLGQAFDHQPPAITWSMTGIPFSMFNSVMYTRLEKGDPAEAIATVQAAARQRNVPVLWWTGLIHEPYDLASHLESAGFKLDEDDPGMAVDLAQLNEAIPPVAGLEIRRVEGNEAVWRQWSRTMTLGFGGSGERATFFENVWWDFMRVADPEVVSAYTGFLDGEPVATSFLVLGAGVAGVYGVATVPEARRKGIGAQMTLYPLQVARALGYRAGILQASALGTNVYRSLGFREYSRMITYEWTSEIKP